MYHLWFVYMIIGVYILLPFLKLISDAVITDNKIAIYFILIWFSSNSLIVYYPIQLLHELNLANIIGWPGYFILGFFLNNTKYLKKINRTLSLSLYLLGSLITWVLIWYNFELSPKSTYAAYEYFSPNVLIASTGAFLWFKQTNIPYIYQKTLKILGSVTFPIYFIHILVIAILTGKNHGFAMTPNYLHPIIGISLIAMSTYLISLILCLCAKKIPFSKQILG